MFPQCVTSTEYEKSAAVSTVSIVFCLGTVHDARENKSEWLLLYVLYLPSMKAFIIQLRIVSFCIVELVTVIFWYKTVKIINYCSV